MPDKERKKKPPRHLSFAGQTPKIQIEDPMHERLYEEAYLLCRDEQTGEYDRNTTTWD